MSDYLSVGEVADLLGVSEKTIYRWLWKKLLPGARKLGGIWRVHRQTLIKHLNGPEILERRGNHGF